MIRPHRKAHVKFRKDNPIFYEQIPVLLPRLESIEKNVYKPCTYCNYDPKSDDKYQELVARLSGGSSGNKAQKANTNGGNKGLSLNHLINYLKSILPWPSKFLRAFRRTYATSYLLTPRCTYATQARYCCNGNFCTSVSQ